MLCDIKKPKIQTKLTHFQICYYSYEVYNIIMRKILINFEVKSLVYLNKKVNLSNL